MMSTGERGGVEQELRCVVTCAKEVRYSVHQGQGEENIIYVLHRNLAIQLHNDFVVGERVTL